MRRKTSIASLVVLCAITAASAGAQGVEAARLQAAGQVFQALVGVPEYEVPAALMRSCYAVAIIPGVRRAGLVIGVQRGKGVLLARGAKSGWSRSLFITLRGVSVGWQVGIQASDVVLFFRTRDSVQRVLAGNYTLGVDASLAAGSLGRSAAAVTDQDLTAEIYSYARSRGIFAGLAVQGAALDVDVGAAEAYYRKAGLDAAAVLEGTGLPTPVEAVRLQGILADYEKTLR
jgi:lipid-binding SYLF domain-containing protein